MDRTPPARPGKDDPGGQQRTAVTAERGPLLSVKTEVRDTHQTFRLKGPGFRRHALVLRPLFEKVDATEFIDGRRPGIIFPIRRPVLLTAVDTAVVIAVRALVLSFAALTDHPGRSAIDAQRVWIWPIIVDGIIGASTVAIMTLNGHNRRALIYPGTLLFLGASPLLPTRSTPFLPGDTISGNRALGCRATGYASHLTVHMLQERAEVAES